VPRERLAHNEVTGGAGVNRMKKLCILALIAIVGIAMLIIAHPPKAVATNRVSDSHPPRSAQQASSAGDDEGEVPDVIRFAKNPERMPPFLVNDLDGRVLSTAEWRGKVVIVMFWATWCPPCREEIPEMIDLANRYKDRLQIVGVSEDDDASPEEVHQFARAAKINYPIVMGNGGISREWGGAPALPTSFIVDTEGRVVQKHVGLYPAEVYDLEIRALLGEHVDKKIETFVDQGQIFLKNAANATELPNVDFTGLSASQKRVALKRMNSESCTCGCKLTIAQCRINDTACDVSRKLAAQIVHQAGAAHPAASSAIRQ
jgi:thiol-disulfide isomerase/thioredoxin